MELQSDVDNGKRQKVMNEHDHTIVVLNKCKNILKDEIVNHGPEMQRQTQTHRRQEMGWCC